MGAFLPRLDPECLIARDTKTDGVHVILHLLWGDRHLRPGRAHAEARLDAGSLLPALAGALGLRIARSHHTLGGLTSPLEAASRLPVRRMTSTLASPRLGLDVEPQQVVLGKS